MRDLLLLKNIMLGSLITLLWRLNLGFAEDVELTTGFKVLMDISMLLCMISLCACLDDFYFRAYKAIQKKRLEKVAAKRLKRKEEKERRRQDGSITFGCISEKQSQSC